MTQHPAEQTVRVINDVIWCQKEHLFVYFVVFSGSELLKIQEKALTSHSLPHNRPITPFFRTIFFFPSRNGVSRNRMKM